MHLFEWLRAHPAVPTVASVASLAVLIATVLLLPVLVARMPPYYFLRLAKPGPVRWRHPILRGVVVVLKNVVGFVLLLVGLGMIFLPGPGVLTILIALGLLNFPGKRALELRLLRARQVRRALGWLRKRAGQPPFLLPGDELPPGVGEAQDAPGSSEAQDDRAASDQ